MLRRTAGCLPSPRGVAFLALLAALAAGPDARAQQSFASGQSISPAYEGWVQNEDGSFDLVFGYMNRNWEQVVDVPVGAENTIEPGGPDQGQPTRFQPRRNRFVFSVRVPADFGDRELVWTLTANGETQRAYATLRRDYYIDDLVIQANFGAAGAAGSTPELAENAAPVLAVEGEPARTARVGEAGANRPGRRAGRPPRRPRTAAGRPRSRSAVPASTSCAPSPMTAACRPTRTSP